MVLWDDTTMDSKFSQQQTSDVLDGTNNGGVVDSPKNVVNSPRNVKGPEFSKHVSVSKRHDGVLQICNLDTEEVTQYASCDVFK